MKNVKIKSILSVVAIIVLLCAVILPKNADFSQENSSATTVSAHTAATYGNEEDLENQPIVAKSVNHTEPVALSEEELQNRFISMLNINNAFNSTLTHGDSLAKCAAATLIDYAQDEVGYGLCVSECLVEVFVESFYGVSLEAENLYDDEAPEGFISLPQMGVDINVHSIISVDNTDSGYEVLTLMKSYDGGEEYATCLVSSLFVENCESEFGFNLVYCETL